MTTTADALRNLASQVELEEATTQTLQARIEELEETLGLMRSDQEAAQELIQVLRALNRRKDDQIRQSEERFQRSDEAWVIVIDHLQKEASEANQRCQQAQEELRREQKRSRRFRRQRNDAQKRADRLEMQFVGERAWRQDLEDQLEGRRSE
jgi:hypothetical protein